MLLWFSGQFGSISAQRKGMLQAGIPLQRPSSSSISDIDCKDVDNDTSLTQMRSRGRLAVIVLSMFAAYVAHDYVQELVFSYQSFKFGWFMSLVEVILITLASFIQLLFTQRAASQRSSLAPSFTEAKCAVVLSVFIAITLGTGSAAMAHISFPVKVVMKSSKLLPTMLIRRIFTGTRYNTMQIFAAIGMCVGCAAFALADSRAGSGSRPASEIGIALLSIAVCADACAANTQEALLTRYRIPTSRMVILFLEHN
jgi:adenosine 3'-phospho 5'-phosphosulfate transporter B3